MPTTLKTISKSNTTTPTTSKPDVVPTFSAKAYHKTLISVLHKAKFQLDKLIIKPESLVISDAPSAYWYAEQCDGVLLWEFCKKLVTKKRLEDALQYLTAVEVEYCANFPAHLSETVDSFGVYEQKKREVFARIASVRKKLELEKFSPDETVSAKNQNKNEWTNQRKALFFDGLRHVGVLKGASNNQLATLTFELTGSNLSNINSCLSNFSDKRHKNSLNYQNDCRFLINAGKRIAMDESFIAYFMEQLIEKE